MLLRRVGFLAALTLLGACSTLSPDDPAATLRAEREGYVAEATQIASNILIQQTQSLETVATAEAHLRQVESRNAALLLTLRAAVPPTQQIISDSGIVTPGQVATPAPPGSVGAGNVTAIPGDNVPVGSMEFLSVATALTVRDSDGCADLAANSFTADVQRIYVTARAQNIAQGTVMRVEWFYEGSVTFSESFTIGVNDDDYCLWFYIEPTETAFSPGNWSVQLYANEQAIQPNVAFTIGDVMTEG
ncbi:MAG: hypothetical protein JNL42_04765 [Anaerolineae bacterium]|nr:hypothetical protein [Anaerolineae bacterium]